MWLRERSFAEPLGDGIALHELVRKALHGDLRHRDRERERDLRRRIADHLHAKAVAGHQLLSIDLSHLVENEAIRWGFSWDGSGEHRLDEVRPGDEQAVRQLLAERRAPERWGVLEPYFAQAPERIAIVRDLGDRIRGFELSVTSANAPPLVGRGPAARAVAGARARGRGGGRAVLWQAAVDFTADPRTGVQAMLGMSGILRSGLENPRYAYLPIDPRLEGAVRFAQAAGGRHVPELDVTLDGRLTQCYLLDYGPGGLLGAQRALIYAELGLALPPAPTAEPEPRPSRLVLLPSSAVRRRERSRRGGARRAAQPRRAAQARRQPACDAARRRRSGPRRCARCWSRPRRAPSARPPTSSCSRACSNAATSTRRRATSRPPTSSRSAAPPTSGGCGPRPSGSRRCSPPTSGCARTAEGERERDGAGERLDRQHERREAARSPGAAASSRIGSSAATAPSGSRNQTARSASRYWIAR